MPSVHEIHEKLLEKFPFETPRAEQLAAFEELSPWLSRLFTQDFKNPLFFGADLPTGVGKSPLAVTVAEAVKALYNETHGDTTDEATGEELAQVWVVTQNKLLQDQYQRDFPDELFDLRGLDNYECNFDPGKTCGQSVCGRIKATAKDKGLLPPKFCSFDCEYDKAKKAAHRAPILSLNVAKALTMLKMGYRPLMMIFDEGHEVESALDNESTFTVEPDTLQDLGLLFPKYFHDLKDIEEIKKGMESLYEDAYPLKKAEEKAADRNIRRFKRLESLCLKISTTLGSMDQGIEYVSCSEQKLELKPLQVRKVFEKFFEFPTLFLSATLLSKRGFQAITGVQDQALGWFACNSPFPVANRPIRLFWRMGARPLNYENLQSEMPNLVARTEAILKKHTNDRGLIHTHTYKIAERLYQDLYPKFGSRLVFPKTAKEQKEALKRHAETPGSVLISPSMTQGVDLRDDLCRFVVMAKVPWLPTNDPVVKARMEADANWYTFKSCMTVVQAPGRGVRSSTDYADTYLIDPGFQAFFNRSKQHLPKWFLDSIVPKAQGPY